MITNKKMCEMIMENMNDNNQSLREQLRKHFETNIDESQTMARKLAEFQHDQISKLKTEFDSRLVKIHDEIKNEITDTVTRYTQVAIQKIIEYYDLKIDSIRTEFNDKLDENHTEMQNTSRCILECVTNLQKDTAIIMETLQLILTNMMLGDVENSLIEGAKSSK
ncbi:MAG: hypothetical protein IJN43_15045 [Ruminococcus sp.]|nr:hypothetical protein [Ruminococcus sp.]